MPPVKRTPFNLDQYRIPRGRVCVLSERCKGCGLCLEYCPQKILAWSTDYNLKGHRYPVLEETEETYCISCRFCEEVCPDFAIYVTTELTAKPEEVMSDE